MQGFWRNWHASYNRWLVRYLYVPLGGSRWRAANVWLVFTFVALWHDLEWRLLGWAWASALLFAPELVRQFTKYSINMIHATPMGNLNSWCFQYAAGLASLELGSAQRLCLACCWKRSAHAGAC